MNIVINENKELLLLGDFKQTLLNEETERD